MNLQTFWSGVRNLTGLIIVSLAFSHQALSLDYTVSPEGAGFKAVDESTGQPVFESNKAHEVINKAIEQVSAAVGGGKVHLVAGTYEVTDFDTITGDNANWVSVRSDVTINNNVTNETEPNILPPYQPQGSAVTKITIAGNSRGNPDSGVIAYINFDAPFDFRKYRALAFWLFPNKRIMTQNYPRFEINFYSQPYDTANPPLPVREMKVWHPEPGPNAYHARWRGHRLPSISSDGKLLPAMTGIRSMSIEILPPLLSCTPDNAPACTLSTDDTDDTVLYLDNLTAHYGQIEINKDKGHENVILEGDGPYHTIIKMKDYGNLPMIYLTGKNSEIRYLQIYGNTDNATLIDYCGGIDSPWKVDLTGTKIHHNFIHQTQGSSINMRGDNTQIYENLLIHSENPHINAANSQNTDIANNTLKYSTNDAFIYLKYSDSFNNQIRNNSFWPITSQLRDSNSPDNPTSYPERFNAIVNTGLLVYSDTYGHTIKGNKFYNMKNESVGHYAVLIQDGAHDISVTDNHFYNSGARIRKGTLSPYNVDFTNNYYNKGTFTITNVNNIEIERNAFTEASKVNLTGSGHSGNNNYFDPSSWLLFKPNGNSGVGYTFVAPVFNETDAGNSWEWGLVFNGGMEEGRGLYPDGWVPTGSDAYTTHVWTDNPTEGVHGVKAIQTVVTGGAANHVAGWSTREPIRVFPGEVLTVHALMKGQGGARFDVLFFKENGSACAVVSDTVGAVTVNDAWVRLKKDITIPADCAKVSLGFYLAGAGGNFTADEVKLYRKMNLEEISSSVSLDNPSFETFTGVVDDLAEDDFSWTKQTQPPTSMLLAVTDSVDGVTALKIHNSQIGTNARASQQVYTLQPDTNYFLEFWAKRDPGVAVDEGRVQLVDLFATSKLFLQNDLKTWSSAGAYLQALSIREIAWTRKAINFRTPPANVFSGNIELRFFNNGSTGLYLDNVRLYRGFGQPGRPRIVAAVTGLTATATGAGRIDLDWSDNGEVDLSHYLVYRSLSSGGPFTKISTNVAVSNFADTGLSPSTQYYYVVTGVNTSGAESTYSKQASATAQ